MENRAAIDGLEADLASDPDSVRLRQKLLEAYAHAGLWSAPRRAEHIIWFVRNAPGHPFCRTPFTYMDPESAPAAHAEIKKEWLGRLASAPDDAAIARGTAAYLSEDDRAGAADILRKATAQHQADPGPWEDLGRISPDPAERLAALERARALGSTHPNLLVWLARSAIDAGNDGKAKGFALELLGQTDALRAEFETKLDWRETGRALWSKARAASGGDDEARALIHAIAENAFCKHWGHTTLGLVEFRRGDAAAAVGHLRASSEVGSDYRLSAYGPSLALLGAVCTLGRWSEALAYLRSWESVCGDGALADVIAQVERHELPTEEELD